MRVHGTFFLGLRNARSQERFDFDIMMITSRKVAKEGIKEIQSGEQRKASYRRCHGTCSLESSVEESGGNNLAQFL